MIAPFWSHCLYAAGAGRDQLFENIFGNQELSLDVPIQVDLLVDNQVRGQVGARFSRLGTGCMVESAPVIELFREMLTAEAFANTKQAMGADQALDLTALNLEPIDIDCDSKRLKVVVSIPIDLRRVQQFALMDRDPLGSKSPVPAPGLSGYLNMRPVWTADYGGAVSSNDWRLDLESVVTVGLWAIELHNTQWTQRGLVRGRATLLRDFPYLPARLTVGEFPLPEQMYFATGEVRGISFGSEFSMRPEMNLHSSTARRLQLDRASVVEIWINGRQIMTRHLPPGQYDITEFPLVVGTNDVQFRVYDLNGRETDRQSFSLFSATRLLAGDRHEFLYQWGAPLAQVGSPVFSFAERYGLSDKLTGSAWGQASSGQGLLGVSLAGVSKLGFLEGRIAATRKAGITDTAYQMFYQYVPQDPRKSSLEARLDYRGNDFSPVGAPTAPREAGLALRWSRDVGQGSRLLAGFILRKNGKQRGTSKTLNAFFSTKLWQKSRLDIGLSWVRDDQDHGLDLTINFSTRLGRENRFRSSVDTKAKRAYLDVYRAPPAGIGNWGGSIQWEQAQTTSTLSASVFGHRNRFEYQVNQSLQFASVSHYRTSVSVGLAIAFAGDAVTIGRPITDAFALLREHPSIHGYLVGIDPVNGHYLATVNGPLPALISDLSSYRSRILTIEGPGLPAGYDLGETLPLARPGYRGGVLLEAGGPQTITFGARLHDANGRPVALATGKMICESDGKVAENVIFTNRIGRMQVSGLRPGSCSLIVGNYPKTEIIIPDGLEGLYDVGEIVLD